MTGELRPPHGLVRFALDPAGVVTPDLGAKLPGRGAWVSSTREAVIAAAAKGLFARAFRAEARLASGLTPAGLADLVEAGLAGRALAALGLARRAGKAVAGFEKMRIALKDARIGVLVIASDAAADGADKLTRLAGSAPRVMAFDSAALSRALGIDGVVYAGLAACLEAERFLREVERLSGFRATFGSVGEAVEKVA